jgi:hypothetical protein
MNLRAVWGLLRRGGMSLPLGLVLASCAWVEPPPTQSIALRVLAADGAELERASCRLSSDRGVWHLEAPGTVAIPRSRAALDVLCEAGGRAGFMRAQPVEQVWRASRLATVGGLHEMMDPWRYRPMDYPSAIDIVLGERRGLPPAPAVPPPVMGR